MSVCACFLLLLKMKRVIDMCQHTVVCCSMCSPMIGANAFEVLPVKIITSAYVFVYLGRVVFSDFPPPYSRTNNLAILDSQSTTKREARGEPANTHAYLSCTKYSKPDAIVSDPQIIRNCILQFHTHGWLAGWHVAN